MAKLGGEGLAKKGPKMDTQAWEARWHKIVDFGRNPDGSWRSVGEISTSTGLSPHEIAATRSHFSGVEGRDIRTIRRGPKQH